MPDPHSKGLDLGLENHELSIMSRKTTLRYAGKKKFENLHYFFYCMVVETDIYF